MDYASLSRAYCPVSEFAFRLGVSERRVRRAIGRGDLRAVRLSEHGPWSVPFTEFDRLMRTGAPKDALDGEDGR